MALLMVSVIGNAFGSELHRTAMPAQPVGSRRLPRRKRLPRQQESPASRPSPSSPTRTPYPTRCCTHDGLYSAHSPSARATCIRVR